MTGGRVVLLAGVPGAGKTTVSRAALAPYMREPARRPFAHSWLLHPDTGQLWGVELGAEREAFGGTDALSMSVLPKVLEWLAPAAPAPVVYAEGDRLATVKFLQPLADAGYDCTLAVLRVADTTAEARRAARGSSQAATWAQGRGTKVANLQAAWEALGGRVHVIDGEQPVEVCAEQLHALLVGVAA